MSRDDASYVAPLSTRWLIVRKTELESYRINGGARLGTSGYTVRVQTKRKPLLAGSEHLSGAVRSGPEEKPRTPDKGSVSEVVQLAQKGDAAAFEFIYRLHCRRVYALCLRMVKDPGDAEDLTQDAFMQVFRKIHTFRGEAAFSS
jgi:hypothetical protein